MMTEMIHSEVHAPIAGKAEPMFNVKIGNCEYIVGVCFSKTSCDTFEDRLKRMIRSEVMANKS